MEIYHHSTPPELELKFIRVHNKANNIVDFMPFTVDTPVEGKIEFLSKYKGAEYSVTIREHPCDDGFPASIPVVDLYDEGVVKAKIVYDLETSTYEALRPDSELLATGFENSYQAQKFLCDLWN